MDTAKHRLSRLRRALLTSVFILLPTTACAQSPIAERELSTGHSEPLGVLESRQQALLTALSARDLDATMSHFASDAVVHVANMPPFVGQDAIRGLYGNVFRALTRADYVVAGTTMAASGDLAYSHGAVTTAFRSGDGTTVFPGKFLLVWTQREGDWQLVHYGISNNRSPVNP